MPKSKEMISESDSGSGSEEEVKTKKTKPRIQVKEKSSGSESEEEVKQKSKPKKVEKKKQESSGSESEEEVKQKSKSKKVEKKKQESSGSESDDNSKSKKRTKKGKKDDVPIKKAKTEGSMQKNNQGEVYWDLSSTKRITVRTFKGKLLIDIRTFYDAGGEMRPSSKGIALQAADWNALKSVFDEVDNYVKSQ